MHCPVQHQLVAARSEAADLIGIRYARRGSEDEAIGTDSADQRVVAVPAVKRGAAVFPEAVDSDSIVELIASVGDPKSFTVGETEWPIRQVLQSRSKGVLDLVCEHSIDAARIDNHIIVLHIENVIAKAAI